MLPNIFKCLVQTLTNGNNKSAKINNQLEFIC